MRNENYICTINKKIVVEMNVYKTDRIGKGL